MLQSDIKFFKSYKTRLSFFEPLVDVDCLASEVTVTLPSETVLYYGYDHPSDAGMLFVKNRKFLKIET